MLLGQRPFKICSLKQDLVVIKLHPIGQSMSSRPKQRYMWATCQVPGAVTQALDPCQTMAASPTPLARAARYAARY